MGSQLYPYMSLQKCGKSRSNIFEGLCQLIIVTPQVRITLSWKTFHEISSRERPENENVGNLVQTFLKAHVRV